MSEHLRHTGQHQLRHHWIETSPFNKIIKSTPFEISASWNSLLNDELLPHHLNASYDHEPGFWKATKSNISQIEKALDYLVPVSLDQRSFSSISLPFEYFPVWSNSELANHIKKILTRRPHDDLEGYLENRLFIQAAVLILNEFYDQEIFVDHPFFFEIRKPEWKASKYYKAVSHYNFLKVEREGPAPPIDDLDYISHNLDNIDIWANALKISDYRFSGIVYHQFFDVTEEFAISKIKFLLLDSDAFVAKGSFDNIIPWLSSYLDTEELTVGSFYLDGYNIPENVQENHLLVRNLKPEQLVKEGSVYYTALKEARNVIIPKMNHLQHKSEVEQALISAGFNSLAVLPLYSENQAIGFVEIASKTSNQINDVHEPKLRELNPLFEVQARRQFEFYESQINRIIMEEFTAIHPTVEWKFLEVARNHQLHLSKGEPADIEDVVFKDIYPLYGQADIMGSTRIRNRATEKDLRVNLERAISILKKASRNFDNVLIRHYIRIAQQQVHSLDDGLDSNEETNITRFILDKLIPFFNEVLVDLPTVNEELLDYLQSIDHDTGMYSPHRREYQLSMSMINELILDYLNSEEEELQKIVPHYAEKYRTDGIHYDIAVGQSLSPHHKFTEAHLKSLRLWQLESMCQIIRRLERQRPELPFDMKVACMILVYGLPITIHFRKDEKQFDVESGHNVQYQIVKKRIDKSLIAGTNERLTQHMKIALVFTSEDDKEEYMEYYEYLRGEGMIEADIEKFELETFIGLEGLTAWRFTVKL